MLVRIVINGKDQDLTGNVGVAGRIGVVHFEHGVSEALTSEGPGQPEAWFITPIVRTLRYLYPGSSMEVVSVEEGERVLRERKG